MSTEQRVTFRAAELRLEGMLAIPEGATHAAAVCHPHPQYGGDMDTNVVRTVTDHLRRAGVATLRFNFRGVGASDGRYGAGVGEAEDARAAVALLQERSGVGHVSLAGYSFGAMVALTAGHDHPGVDRLIAVALPLPMFDLSFLAACEKPKLFVLGERDQYCPLPALERAVTMLAGTNRLERLAGADHFLAGREHDVGAQIAAFVGAP